MGSVWEIRQTGTALMSEEVFKNISTIFNERTEEVLDSFAFIPEYEFKMWLRSEKTSALSHFSKKCRELGPLFDSGNSSNLLQERQELSRVLEKTITTRMTAYHAKRTEKANQISERLLASGGTRFSNELGRFHFSWHSNQMELQKNELLHEVLMEFHAKITLPHGSATVEILSDRLKRGCELMWATFRALNNSEESSCRVIVVEAIEQYSKEMNHALEHKSFRRETDLQCEHYRFVDKIVKMLRSASRSQILQVQFELFRYFQSTCLPAWQDRSEKSLLSEAAKDFVQTYVSELSKYIEGMRNYDEFLSHRDKIWQHTSSIFMSNYSTNFFDKLLEIIEPQVAFTNEELRQNFERRWIQRVQEKPRDAIGARSKSKLYENTRKSDFRHGFVKNGKPEKDKLSEIVEIYKVGLVKQLDSAKRGEQIKSFDDIHLKLLSKVETEFRMKFRSADQSSCIFQRERMHKEISKFSLGWRKEFEYYQTVVKVRNDENNRKMRDAVRGHTSYYQKSLSKYMNIAKSDKDFCEKHYELLKSAIEVFTKDAKSHRYDFQPQRELLRCEIQNIFKKLKLTFHQQLDLKKESERVIQTEDRLKTITSINAEKYRTDLLVGTEKAIKLSSLVEAHSTYSLKWLHQLQVEITSDESFRDLDVVKIREQQAKAMENIYLAVVNEFSDKMKMAEVKAEGAVHNFLQSYKSGMLSKMCEAQDCAEFEKIHNSFVRGSLERFELEHGTDDDEGISARSEFVHELKKQLLISVNEIFEELKEKHRLRLEEQATMEAAAKIRMLSLQKKYGIEMTKHMDSAISEKAFELLHRKCMIKATEKLEREQNKLKTEFVQHLVITMKRGIAKLYKESLLVEFRMHRMFLTSDPLVPIVTKDNNVSPSVSNKMKNKAEKDVRKFGKIYRREIRKCIVNLNNEADLQNVHKTCKRNTFREFAVDNVELCHEFFDKLDEEVETLFKEIKSNFEMINGEKDLTVKKEMNLRTVDSPKKYCNPLSQEDIRSILSVKCSVTLKRVRQSDTIYSSKRMKL